MTNPKVSIWEVRSEDQDFSPNVKSALQDIRYATPVKWSQPTAIVLVGCFFQKDSKRNGGSFLIFLNEVFTELVGLRDFQIYDFESLAL